MLQGTASLRVEHFDVSGTPVFTSGALVWVAAVWGLSLVARGACVLGFHGIVTTREIVLGRLPRPGQTQRAA